jgi:RNA polymerase sigma-70 factor (ECF subfamily)
MAEPPTADEDCRLMIRSREGDREAFRALVVRHQRPLLNFFLRCGVHSDAEDLVQETFVRLYRYRDRYRPRARFTTFLYLLARQVWIDELRRCRRRRRLRDELAEAPEMAPERVPAAAPPGLADDLRQALARLSERLREVVTLGVLQELPYREIAKILKIPVGTVKSRMFNGLRELRRILEEMEQCPPS